MNLLATPGLPSCSNTDYLAEPTQSHTPLSENFIPNENDVEDPIGDSFVNESDVASEPDEAEYPIPPEDGPDRVDINVMAATFAQRGAETSSEPALPADINVKDQTGYDVPYQKAWYSLKMAREIVYGTWESSVQKLPAYLGAIQKYNPGTIVEWKHKGFQASTAAMDGNQQVLSLAFAVVDEETYPSWKWFLQQLSRHVIRGRRGMCLISDRHGGLIKAVREGPDFVSPHGVHRKFNRIMDEIKKQDVKAFAYLDAINKEKWTASHDGGWRCGILTTNMSECINGVLKGARRLPSEDYWDDPNFQLVHDPTIPVALAEESSPPPPPSSSSSSSNSFLSGIANTKSWFQFYGDGFAIRVPPNFEDIMEPEDYNAGLSLYGDKAKPKTYAARFASPDGSEVLSVVVRPSNQLKITFLEAKDIADFGSLKQAARIFVPGGATLYSARTFKIKEEEGYRNYYFYEFGRDEQHVALVAAVNSGKAIIAGATAPQNKWDDDGVRLRSAAVSLTLL
ncbi:hypothetical protein Sango_0158400 [Sesamum angolense]|uniref:MULE transposase domain-containing protein n=3 Tax=Sesamum TaxID=4181 RepID=A0AAE2C6I1_9LAMI|nr:hypothetical protein Sango_0158400 [Sesamum angolense]